MYKTTLSKKLPIDKSHHTMAYNGTNRPRNNLKQCTTDGRHSTK